MSEFDEVENIDKYEVEYGVFLDDFNQAFFNLTSSLEEIPFFQNSSLKILKKILKNENLDLIFFLKIKIYYIIF